MWYKNIAGRFFGLVTKHACDGRTELWLQDRASIARALKTEVAASTATSATTLLKRYKRRGDTKWAAGSYAAQHTVYTQCVVAWIYLGPGHVRHTVAICAGTHMRQTD